MHATYFNAEQLVRKSVTRREIASFVPPPHGGASTVQLDDLTVTADGRIYVTYRGGAGGLYIVQPEIPFG